MSVTHTTDQAPIAPARLLVVEDDPNVRNFCVRLLRMSGYDVTSAENGQVALERLNESQYDLVLTDDHMPIMGGASSCFKSCDSATLVSVRFSWRRIRVLRQCAQCSSWVPSIT
jgi:DNA-binding response OmpR family regulator